MGRADFFGGLFAGANCSAALIHPQVIVTYFDCVADFDEMNFGDHADQSYDVDGDQCLVHPELPIAVCTLAEPVEQIPLHPIAYGCESGIIETGRPVAIAGFGDVVYPAKDPGFKRWAWSEIAGVDEDTLDLFTDGGPTLCGPEDMGGPAYVEYPDGSWHLLGILTGGQWDDCFGGSSYTRLDAVVPWIEDSFGIDVTPCHDVSGAWSPSSECADLPIDGPQGGGDWNQWCDGVGLLPLSATCGPPLDATEDEQLPRVWIEAPADPWVVGSGESFSVSIAVNHPVQDVGLGLDGADPAATDPAWPYGFDAISLADGVHMFEATAMGEDGVLRVSDIVEIYVGVEPPQTGDTTDGEDGDGGSETSGGEPPDGESGSSAGSESGSGAADADDDGGSGCGCRSGEGHPGAAWLWMFGFIAARGRRRRG